MNLTELVRVRGVQVAAACRWYREGKLPVPARKAGRLVLVSLEAPAAGSGERAGLYARVSSHDQRPALEGGRGG